MFSSALNEVIVWSLMPVELLNAREDKSNKIKIITYLKHYLRFNCTQTLQCLSMETFFLY